MSNKLIKFELPAGAIISGMRHLGGGVFVGDLMPKKRGKLDQKMPIVLECTIPVDAEEFPFHLPTEVVDDPYAGEGSFQRTITLIGPQRDGVILPETEWAEVIGLSKEEFDSRRAEWIGEK